ncbi:MAG: hypothetical protein JWO68_137 [Actinomycetia bacterium]|nr:hypothetical protein [Actinomycetes bacterium]
MSDTPQTGTRVADHNVVATFESPDQARAALTLLERKGVEAADIELFGPGAERAHRPITNDEQLEVDLQTTTVVAKRSSAIGFVAAVVGAVVVGVVGYAAGDGTGALVGALGGFIVFGLLGFLWGGYSGLAVDEEWADTFAAEGEVSVAVHSAHEKEIEAAVEAFKGTAATRLAVYDRDGQLRDVA